MTGLNGVSSNWLEGQKGKIRRNPGQNRYVPPGPRSGLAAQCTVADIALP
jgi:hypothetical protein